MEGLVVRPTNVPLPVCLVGAKVLDHLEHKQRFFRVLRVFRGWYYPSEQARGRKRSRQRYPLKSLQSCYIAESLNRTRSCKSTWDGSAC
jgi:hypothetical protein